MALTRATAKPVGTSNRPAACPSCGSEDVTPAGSLAGLFDAMTLASLAIPVGTNKAMPARRKCKACDWVSEVA